MRRQVTADELAEFYQLIGAAIWHVQYLEDALATFLTMKLGHEARCAGSGFAPDEATTLLAARRRLTFGPLLESALSRKVVRRAHKPRFETFKEERHWLVHRSMVENSDDLYLESTRMRVFGRVALISDEAIDLKNIVVAELEAWAVAHGVDQQAVDEQAAEAIRGLKGA